MLHPILNACRLGLAALLFSCAGNAAYAQSAHTSRVAWTLTSAGVAGNPQTETKKKGRGKLMVYIGTYTAAKSKGIYIFRMDPTTGDLTAVGVSPEVANPSFVTIHPNRHYLYAVNEISDYEGKKSGAVSAFSIDPATGMLTLLNQQSSQGDGPCHLTVDHSGKNVLVANYGSGSVASLPIQEDGKLGAATSTDQHEGSSVNKSRQEGPHGHSIYMDPFNRYVLSCDLGLDKVMIYRYDAAKGVLTPSSPAYTVTEPGAGPRHLAFHPNKRYAYVINEMGNTIVAYTYDQHTGLMTMFQTVSTLPDGFTGDNTTAEIAVHPSGKFLYGSNRGDDSIAIFTVDPATGKLTAAGRQSTQGKTPRNFAIDPTGQFLLAANQNSDNVVVFRIDQQTGQLTPTGNSVEVSMPVSIAFLPIAH
jgi:6-phosphogluconolactonase